MTADTESDREREQASGYFSPLNATRTLALPLQGRRMKGFHESGCRHSSLSFLPASPSFSGEVCLAAFWRTAAGNGSDNGGRSSSLPPLTSDRFHAMICDFTARVSNLLQCALRSCTCACQAICWPSMSGDASDCLLFAAIIAMGRRARTRPARVAYDAAAAAAAGVDCVDVGQIRIER